MTLARREELGSSCVDSRAREALHVAGGPSTFAASKFHAPVPGSRHVRRPSLCARLDDGDDQIRLVIGSPGAGKTSLLAELFATLYDPGCWVNLDEGDRDPVRFWSAFLAATQAVTPSFAADCSDLLRLDPRIDHEFLEQLLRAVDALDHPLTVVLDDFHLAGDALSDHLRFLLHRGVYPMQLTLGTRREPDIGLHRLRMDGRLCELREVDLRFDRDDAEHFLALHGATLGPDGLDVVLARTEGWAAGLQLTALAVRDTDDPQAVVDRLTGTHQLIAHYLWSEVYERQPHDVQRFLLDTCVVDELTPTLAAALSPDNPVTLFDIEASNLLLRRVDAAGTTFRYHQLLLDMLRFRARAGDPQHVAALHERAAQWHEAHDDPIAAFRHRWRAGQRAEALVSVQQNVFDVIYDALPSMNDVGRALTDDDIRSRPGPAASLAVALVISGVVTEAERLADRVEALAQLNARERLQIDSIRAIGALVTGDTAAAATFGRTDASGVTPDQVGPWMMVLQMAAARGEIWELELDSAAGRMQDILPPHSSTFDRVEVDSTVAHLELVRGRLSACAEIVEAREGETPDVSEGRVADGLLLRAIRGTIHLERDELSAAEPYLREVSDTETRFRVPAVVLARIGLSRLRAAGGKSDAALVLLEGAYHAVPARPRCSGLLDHLRRQHVRVLLDADSVEAAADVAADITLPRLRRLVEVELALTRGDVDRARDEVAELAPQQPSDLRQQLENGLAALAVAIAGGEATDEHAATVLQLTEPQGFLFPLVEAGADVLGAIQQEARRHQRTPYIDKVLRLVPKERPQGSGPTGVEMLTQRERTVLRYMATSMSYAEIAG